MHKYYLYLNSIYWHLFSENTLLITVLRILLQVCSTDCTLKNTKNLSVYYWVFVSFFLFMSFEPFLLIFILTILILWLLHQCVSLSNLSLIMEAKLDIGLDTFYLRIFEWKFNVEDYIYKLTMFPKYYILCNTQTKWY